MRHKVSEVIVVEGKYDKNTLSQIFDATVVQTDGFGIFRDEDKLRLIRLLAEKRGVVILTDSDYAGFVIRAHLKSSLAGLRVLHAYIPDIYGKERRKQKPSGEGKLGVEGMRPEVLIEALVRSGATVDGETEQSEHLWKITKADFYADGLSGTADSEKKRKALLKELDLPEHLSANALIEVLNAAYSFEEYKKLVSQLSLV